MLVCRRLTPFYLVKRAVFSERSAALVSTYNEMRLGGVISAVRGLSAKSYGTSIYLRWVSPAVRYASRPFSARLNANTSKVLGTKMPCRYICIVETSPYSWESGINKIKCFLSKISPYTITCTCLYSTTILYSSETKSSRRLDGKV